MSEAVKRGAYLRHYGEVYKKETGKDPTVEVLARIHNGGPRGWKKEATRSYWARVERRLKP